MNKQKFIAYLRKPSDLDEQSIESLQQVVSENPYFQSARSLLAKAAKQNKSKDTPRIINKAAVYATDRILLKKYLNDELIFLKPIEVHESHEAERERDLSDAIKVSRRTATQNALKLRETEEKERADKAKKAKEKATNEAKENKEETNIPEKQEQETAIEVDKSGGGTDLDSIIEELYHDMEELKANRAKFKEIEDQLAEDEAVSAAVEKAQSKVKKEPVKKPSESRSARTSKVKPEEEKPAEKKKAAPKKTSAKKSTSSTSKKASTAKKTTSTAKNTTATKTTTKKTTTSTRKSTAAAKKTTAKKPAAKKKEEGSDSKSKDDKGDPQRKKLEQNDIIDNFIKTNPSISPADGSAPIAEDLADESVQLHPEVASEYLAEIYLEQGKKERAIEIYQSLILKFPQKKSYFAGLIENLK